MPRVTVARLPLCSTPTAKALRAPSDISLAVFPQEGINLWSSNTPLLRRSRLRVPPLPLLMTQRTSTLPLKPKRSLMWGIFPHLFPFIILSLLFNFLLLTPRCTLHFIFLFPHFLCLCLVLQVKLCSSQSMASPHRLTL
jgi:hypothetical protein